MKKSVSILIILTFVFALVFFCGGNVLAKNPKLPNMLRIWTHGSGTTGYYSAMGMGPVIQERTGMLVRLVPAESDVARFMGAKQLAKGSQSSVLLLTDASTWTASRAALDFAAPQWGPQKVRLIYGGTGLHMGVMTRADSGIKVMSDLKGKRWPRLLGYPAVDLFHNAFLAFGGLTNDDVKLVTYSSWSDAMRSVLRGECDATGTTFTTAAAVETAAGPHGIYHIPMPPDDKKAWDRFHEYMPFAHPHLNTRGGGLSPENPHHGMSYREPYSGYAHVPDEVVYAFAKAAYEGYDDFKDKHSDLVDFSPDCTVEHITEYPIPMHPGSIKFFKEIGKWNDKAQKWQEERLLLEEEIEKAWLEAPFAAEKVGINLGGKGWVDFWEKFRNERLSKLDLKYAYK